MTKPATEQVATDIPVTDNPQHVTVQLNVPIQRKGGDITSLTLRKPKAGDLRDLKLRELLESDTGSMMKLLPRISDPSIIAQEAEALEVDDFIEISGAVHSFFMTRQERAMVAQAKAKMAENLMA